ncbi:MAG TPA: ornithine cyclodeaminase family protein [Candidatus Limnocylindria bacterium]|nr:ornithine cyclodeaminase family protein [Candidatus Limnocylindria bacterium]
MRVFHGEAIRAAVPMADLLDAVEGAFRDVAEGRDRSPVRTRLPLPNGDLLLMPGLRDGGGGTAVKLVTVVPDNAARGLPTVQAVIVWFDGTSGEPLAVLDGTTVTGMRTGAASGVATRLLARPDARALALFGCGAQAAWQVRAVCAARTISSLRVYARDESARAAFAEEMAAELGAGVDVVAAPSAQEALHGADVVCCATTSSTPLFDADWVDPGTHVNAIGAYRLDMVELPPELFARAAVVAVDSRSAVLQEAGDLVGALERGLLARDGYVELGRVEARWSDGRDPSAITVFKSVGLAIQDVAAAELIAGRLLGIADPEA